MTGTAAGIVGCARIAQVAMILVAGSAAAGRPPAQDPQLARIFAHHGVRGTLVIADLAGKTRYVHDPARAERRLIPASTFKVPNALIVLEERAVKDAAEKIPWDGKKHAIRAWNRDHTLKSALRSSCVWCFQRLARKVGAKRYAAHLERMGYGNARVGDSPASFWLDGTLLVSAAEQVAFLRQLVRRKLGFRAEVYDAVARIMVHERGTGYVLRAKTGWSRRADPDLGWLVGYVERGKRVWLFALNIDVGLQDARKRWLVAREALRAKGALP